MKQKSEKSTPLRSADRLLTILRLFSHSRTSLRVADVVTELGLATSTVRRLLALLEQHELVRSDRATGSYVIHSEILRLAQVGEWQGLLTGVADPLLERLHKETSETVILSRREGGRVLRVLSKITTHALQVEMGRAAERPIYVGSATGKTLLAWESEATLAQLLPDSWEPLTSFTPSNRSDYLAELANVRARGYAINRQESELGVWAIAAPVFDITNNVVAALTVPMPRSRLDSETEARLVSLVPACAQEVTVALRKVISTGENTAQS